MSGRVLSHRERLILHRLGNVPRKKYRLAITTLRTFDTRSAQSNIVIVRFQSYAPTLRCRCVVTPRLVANKDYVTMPLLPPSKRLRCLCEMFSCGHRLASCAPSVRCRHVAIPRRPLQSEWLVMCDCHHSSRLNFGGICDKK